MKATFMVLNVLSHTTGYDSYTLQLQKHTMYKVQIRRKAKQSLLWSDWSQTSDIPIGDVPDNNDNNFDIYSSGL